MKKSIYLFAAILISSLIIDRALYFIILHMDKSVQTGISVGKVNQFMMKKETANLLVFGNSRASRHVNIQLLDSSGFNIGRDGRKIAFTAALISSIKKKDQIFLVHIDPNELIKEDYTGIDCLMLSNLYFRDRYIRKFIKRNQPFESLIYHMFHVSVYRNKLLIILRHFFIPPQKGKELNGYEPLFPTKRQLSILNRRMQRTYIPEKSKNDRSFNDFAISMVDTIINCSKRINSKLVFFTSPILVPAHPSLRSATSQLFKDKSIPYYDFSDSIPYSPDIENWKDQKHLSHKGAILFTQMLKKKLNDTVFKD